MDELFHFLPQAERQYTLMDMENSGACELDKRCRTLFNGKKAQAALSGWQIAAGLFPAGLKLVISWHRPANGIPIGFGGRKGVRYRALFYVRFQKPKANANT